MKAIRKDNKARDDAEARLCCVISLSSFDGVACSYWQAGKLKADLDSTSCERACPNGLKAFSIFLSFLVSSVVHFVCFAIT